VSVGRATHNGVARRSCGEWGRLLEDRDRWRAEALETERALAATTAELADALALAAMLDRREGPNERRVLSTDSRELFELRQGYGRRHADTCKLSVCQCGQWNPAIKRYVAP
jgi:hypothetical protein